MKRPYLFLLILLVNIAKGQQPVKLNDFAKAPAGSLPAGSISSIRTSYLFFLVADNGIHGEELWRSNGSEGGTQMIKDINPTGSSSPVFLFVKNEVVYFFANDGIHGVELWRSDGTAAGTYLLKDINPGNGGSYAYLNECIEYNGFFYFLASNGVHGRELWKTDGTPAGTTLVKDIFPGSSGSNPRDLYVANDLLFFTANNGAHGVELWKTDGTSAGTQMVTDLTAGADRTWFRGFVALENGLFFKAGPQVATDHLWKTDGTEAGTVKVFAGSTRLMAAYKDTLYFTPSGGNLYKVVGDSYAPTISDLTINAMQVFNNHLILEAASVEFGRELWKSDGTAAGSSLLADINPGAEGSFPGDFYVHGFTLYFTAYSTTHGRELWRTNGTAAGTVMVRDIYPGVESSVPGAFSSAGNLLFFTAEDGDHGRELWVTNGQEPETVLLKDFMPGAQDGFGNFFSSGFFKSFGSRIFFAQHDDENGLELWTSDGTSTGTSLVKNINTKTQNISLLSQLADLNGRSYFITPDGLWETDGTLENTELLKEMEGMQGLVALDNMLLFSATTSETGRELWKTDGTLAGTEPLKEVNPGPGNGVHFGFFSLPRVGENVIFPGTDGEAGAELWITNGTPEGTQMVKDANPGSGSLRTAFHYGDAYHQVINDVLYFMADDDINDDELWKSDGTPEGTMMVRDINPFGASSPSNFTSVNNTIFFQAFDNVTGYELWKTDGTEMGTQMVKDIHPEGNGVMVSRMAVLNDILYFTATDGDSGYELWKSNGTGEGTVLVKDLRFGEEGSSPQSLVVVGGKLYFTADDGVKGRQLWFYDGVNEPQMVKDLGPQAFQNVSLQLTEVEGSVFFQARDSENGAELWRTDGTAEGTVRMTDIAAGTMSSAPVLLAYQNHTLYFTADDGLTGSELWSLKPAVPQTNISASTQMICSSEDTVLFSVTVENAGANPRYAWYIDDQIVLGEETGEFTATNLSGGEKIKAQIVAGNDVWTIADSIYSEVIEVEYAGFVPEISAEDRVLTVSEGESFRWYLNGELLPDNTQTIAFPEDGIYRVEVTNAAGCTALSEEVTVSMITGFEKGSVSASSVELYPNPVAGQQVFIDSQTQDELDVHIYNGSGSRIYQGKLSGKGKHEISLGDLSGGVYMVTCTGKQNTYQFKFIKY